MGNYEKIIVMSIIAKTLTQKFNRMAVYGLAQS
jgi:hypothetical protein